MGKIIAFDIGEKRIGVARSDDAGIFAFPLTTINVTEGIETDIDRVIQEERPEKIAVGLPRNMDGSLGFQSEKVKEFVETNLAKYKEIVEYEDESATSLEAEEEMKREGKDPRKDKVQIDAYAAKIILESYLNK